MVSHICQYCNSTDGRIGRSIVGHSTNGHVYQTESSGDVEIVMEVGGREYKFVVPDLILHYIAVHGFCPCPDFVDVVMHGEKVVVIRSKNAPESIEENLDWFEGLGYEPVGYLVGEFATGEVPDSFLEKLQELMETAEGFPGTY